MECVSMNNFYSEYIITYLSIFVARIPFSCYYSSKKTPNRNYLLTILMRQTYGTKIGVLTHTSNPLFKLFKP